MERRRREAREIPTKTENVDFCHIVQRSLFPKKEIRLRIRNPPLLKPRVSALVKYIGRLARAVDPHVAKSATLCAASDMERKSV